MATVEVYPSARLGIEVNRDAARRRRERWELLRWQWKHSTDKRLHYCRKTAFGEMVGLRAKADGAYWTGLMTCKSVWICPVCSAIIRSRRAEMIEESCERWLGGGEGRSLGFLTLTVRHARSERLKDLYGDLAKAWKRLRESRWWQKLGLSGYWRASEITYGSNGWHPHLHLLLFSEGSLIVDPVELSKRWQAAVTAVGMKPTTLARGARLQAVDLSEGVGGSIARYLSKVLDGNGKGWDVGSELARSDRKRGGKGGFSPMELLAAAADGEAWAASRWWEYEAATKGRRAIESSRGLLEMVGMEEVEDEDLAEEEEGGEAILTLHRSDYYRLAVAGYSAHVLDAAEAGDGPTTVIFVEALLRLIGGD